MLVNLVFTEEVCCNEKQRLQKSGKGLQKKHNETKNWKQQYF